MPLQQKTYEFEAEIEATREDMAELAEEQANYEGPDRRAEAMLQQGLQLESRVNSLEWAADEWDVDSVTFAGLTSGEINLVEDTAESYDSVRERDAFVAAGTQDAPYLQHDPEYSDPDVDDFEETVMAVTELPRPFVMWAEEKIGELSHVEMSSGNGYLDMVADKQSSSNSRD